jgi:hypothetical protein
MNLLRFAALLAQVQGADTMTLTTLNRAFEKRLRKHMAKRANPFTAETDLHFTPPPELDNDIEETGRRGSRKPKVSQVLTASGSK